MKKFKFLLMGIIFVGLMPVFVACSVDYSKFAGKYTLVSITNVLGSTQNIEDLTSSGMVSNASDEYFELNADQTFTTSGLFGEHEGTFSIEGNNLNLTIGQDVVFAHIENNVITINYNNNTYVFERKG